MLMILLFKFRYKLHAIHFQKAIEPKAKSRDKTLYAATHYARQNVPDESTAYVAGALAP